MLFLPHRRGLLTPGVFGDSDPFWANVTLLLHGNGANGSTTIVDSSLVGNTITASGNLQNSSEQGKFGNSLKFDGTGDYGTTPYSTGNFDWFTSDYTIEGWVYPTTFTGASVTVNAHELPAFIGNMDPVGVTNFWSFGPDKNGNLSFGYFNGAVQGIASSGALSLNAWTHIALTLASTTIRLFRDGTLDGSASIIGTPQSNAGTPLSFGQYDSNKNVTGWADDIRITKGVARYTSSFTPPTKQFPDG